MRMHRFALDQAGIAEGSAFPRRRAVQQYHLGTTALQMQRDGNTHHPGTKHDYGS
jgi:hypothetical protein